jgi:hypothetical protein
MEIYPVISADFADDSREGFVDVEPLFGGCLDAFTVKASRKLSSLCKVEWDEVHKIAEMGRRTVHAHLPFILQITFVRYDDDGERVFVLYAENLLVEVANCLEGTPRCDRIDEEETLS